MASVTYQCKNCGGALEFDAKTQKFVCPFCKMTYEKNEFDSINGEKETVEENNEQTQTSNKVVEYHCPTCGAVVYTDENTVATFCGYCQSPVIMSDRVSDEFKPAKIIPFTIPKEEAREKFIKWARGRKFLPKGFVSHQNVEKLTGMYVPFWLYDCNMNGQINATGKNIRVTRRGDTEYTTTKIYDVVRAGEAYFEKIPVDGSSKMDNKTMDLIEPYDYSRLQDFSMPYLSGFQAEKYDEDDKKCYPRVKQKSKEYMEKLLRDTIVGYSSVTINRSVQSAVGVKAHYTLLPIYTLNYRKKDKMYNFTMNGETGKIIGKTPLSWGKIARFFGIATACGTVLAYIFSLL